MKSWQALRKNMTTRPRTIQIFLPDGDPSRIRVAELLRRLYA